MLEVPRVSVLLPVWNGEAFLKAAIESILRQTLTSFELIVIDDGSTDASAAIAGKFACADDRVRVLRRAHEGLSASLNAGIAAARGEYVARIPVATDVGGNAEVVDDGATGYVAAAPTEDALDDAMERAWNERHRWREVGAAAAARIRLLVPREPERCFARRLVELASSPDEARHGTRSRGQE